MRPSSTPPVVLSSSSLSKLLIMRFSTIFTVIAAGALALAGAVPDMIEKRTGDITSIFNTLNDQCNDILPQFGDCYDDDCTTSIVADLNVAIKACTSSLGGISGLILLPPPGLVSLVANIVVVSSSKFLELHFTHATVF